MNKNRLFFTALTGLAGCWCFAASSFKGQAQQPDTGVVRPTVKPVADLAANTALPAETTSTPAPDADTDEKSPPVDEAAPNKDTVTVIDSANGMTFKDNVVVFDRDVKVVDPRFQLVCDRLTVFLNKRTPAGQNAAGAPTPASSATPAPLPSGKKNKGGGVADPNVPGGGNGSGIDHAVAEGHVVILQKKAPTKEGEEEKISIGRGEVGTFDNKSGDMTLKGWPSLEQNGSSLIATSHDTVMIIHHDSSLDTRGPSQTKLVQHNKGGANNGSVFDIPSAPSNSGGGNRRGNNPPAPTASPAASPRRGAASH